MDLNLALALAGPPRLVHAHYAQGATPDADRKHTSDGRLGAKWNLRTVRARLSGFSALAEVAWQPSIRPSPADRSRERGTCDALGSGLKMETIQGRRPLGKGSSP